VGQKKERGQTIVSIFGRRGRCCFFFRRLVLHDWRGYANKTVGHSHTQRFLATSLDDRSEQRSASSIVAFIFLVENEILIPVPRVETAQTLFGAGDESRRFIERELQVSLNWRDGQIRVGSGNPEAAQLAAALVTELLGVLDSAKTGGRSLLPADVRYLVRRAKGGGGVEGARKMLGTVIVTSERGKPIGPRTLGQVEYAEALGRDDMVFAIGPAGTGKCIAGDSLLLTGAGMIEIGHIGPEMKRDDLAPLEGAQTWGVQGLESASHIYCGGQSDTLKIGTRFGFEIEATLEHPLLTLDANGQTAWKRADQLREGDVVALSRGSQLFGTQTATGWVFQRNGQDKCSKPVVADELDESLCYLMGVLTGDGCLTARGAVLLSSADESIVEAFRSLAARFGLHVFPTGASRPYDYAIGSTQLRALLLHLGMSEGKAATKRIPRSILRAPRSLVAAWIRGLFDADGSVEKRDGTITFSTVSPTLARQLQVVLLNFGVVASRAIKRGRYKGEEHLSHLLSIAGQEAERFHDCIGFGLERKRARRQSKTSNPNVDVVPFCGPLLDAAIQSATFSHAQHKIFEDYRSGRRAPSYAKLESLVALLQARAVAERLLAPLLETLSRRFLFLPIQSIKPSSAYVFDLCVPKTHSFVAQGFVNHNTYMAVAAAVAALRDKRVNKLILTRPAVEAGERLGFLPGDLDAKIDPYLRPLYDALYDLLDFEKAQKLFERKVIEIAPLAYMRGRTLSEAFIILDEAQNATGPQMKMFLTRLGFGSKMVVTGDVTQTDLPRGEESGLSAANRILPGVKGISFVYLTQEDVVRHSLVQRIIEAYEKKDGER